MHFSWSNNQANFALKLVRTHDNVTHSIVVPENQISCYISELKLLLRVTLAYKLGIFKLGVEVLRLLTAHGFEAVVVIHSVQALSQIIVIYVNQ